MEGCVTRLLLPVVAAFALVAFQVDAQQDTAGQMLSACKAVPTAQAAAGTEVRLPTDFYTGYCWGAFSSLQSATTSKDWRGRQQYDACVPPQTTKMQLIAAFTRYAGNHPEQMEKDYFGVALDAFKDAFPCSRK
ncbi:MAG: hypothetical protein JWR07_468 [Nevskia sp.]|nr:hypothetical protein [Nevskia sp.]